MQWFHADLRLVVGAADQIFNKDKTCVVFYNITFYYIYVIYVQSVESDSKMDPADI